MFVKPLNGQQVIDPDFGELLPPEGRRVEDNQYWQRRIMDGDVEVAADPNDAKAAASPTADPKKA